MNGGGVLVLVATLLQDIVLAAGVLAGHVGRWQVSTGGHKDQDFIL